LLALHRPLEALAAFDRALALRPGPWQPGQCPEPTAPLGRGQRSLQRGPGSAAPIALGPLEPGHEPAAPGPVERGLATG
jgi:hypothetical protein